MKKQFILYGIGMILLTGCVSEQREAVPPVPAAVAGFTEKVPLDAALPEKVWNGLPEYTMSKYRTFGSMPPATKVRETWEKSPFEVKIRILEDRENLCFAFRVTNDDVRALKQQNQIPLYQYGDTVEVFIATSANNRYGEFYVSAGGNTASIIYPSRSFNGSVLTSLQTLMPGVRVVARVQGTLNHDSDADKGWTAVMSLSKKELEKALQAKFEPGTTWYVLFAAYGISSRRSFVTYASWPELPRTNFHLLEYYAPLQLKGVKK